MVQLEDLFRSLLPELPVQAEERKHFSAATFGPLPDEIECAGLKAVGRTLGHNYGDSARYDVVDFFGDKLVFRRLGLLVMAALLHPNRRISLHLTHPRTQVKAIRIECWTGDPSPKSVSAGLVMLPAAYIYQAAPVHSLHPLWHEDRRIEGWTTMTPRSMCDFPSFDLTNESGRSGSLESFNHREYLDGFGPPSATATLAALLLDLGLPESSAKESCLESPSGNWSVAIGSAEARFYVHPESTPDCIDPWDFW